MLRATDPARLARFYRQLFDVELHEDLDGSVYGQVGGLSLAIVPRRRMSTGFALGRIALAWQVSDIDGALARLDDMTPQSPSWVREDRLTDQGRQVTLFDPEGNELGLLEPLAVEFSAPK